MTTRSIAVVIVSGLATALSGIGCEEKLPQPPLSTPKPAPSSTPAPASPHAAPSAPSAAPAAQSPHAALDPTVRAMGVSVTLPQGWQRNPPANQMRLAEALVPDAGGDPAKSCLVVFSTAGGTVEDNIARWSGQVRDAQGQPVAAKTEKRTPGGVNVTIAEMVGSFAGMGDSAPKQNWMLRGAIIESPEGLLFIKMTGPAEQMTAAGAAFGSMVDSVKAP